MMQNNLMGGGMAQPATAPANPTGLNFQSDPSMRAQFKGFMSGMQAKQPAPMAPSPMQAPLPMSAPMQNVDIFQPQPMQMQMGGPVPRQANMGGMPHMLSYITPGEAAALSAMGGTGQPGPGGVPSFVYDEAGMGFSSSSAPSMGDASFDYSGGGDNDFNVFEDSSDSFTVGPINENYGMDADKAATQDALSTLLAAEALQQDRAKQEALAKDITARGGSVDITEGFGPMSQVTGTRQTPMDPTEFATSNVKSIRDSVDAAAQSNLLDQVFDIDTRSYGPDTRYDIDTSYTPSPAPRPDLQVTGPFQQSNITGPASRPNYVAPNIPAMTPDERNQMARDELGISGNTIGGYDEVGAAIGAPSVGPQPGNLGAMGEGSFPSAPSVSVDPNTYNDKDGISTSTSTSNNISNDGDDKNFFEKLFDSITGKDREPLTDAQIQQNIVDANNRRTSITLGTGAKSLSALDQLAMRAGMSPGSASGQMAKLGGLGAVVGKFGASNAGKMYQDIVNKGYEPVYGAAGQIVATRVPGTNILGRGSIEGAIPGANTGGGGGGSAPRPVQSPQPSVADLVAEELAKLQPAAPAPTQATPTPITPAPVNAGPRAPATGGSSLGFGFGQLRRIPGISSNLNTAADDFLNLLGGANVQGFAQGGQVPRQAEIAGQPHMLSYITPGEAAALQAMGGSGASGPGGIPSFFYDEVGAVEGTTGNFGSGGQNQDFGGGDNDNNDSVSVSSSPSQDDSYTVSTDVANQLNQQANRDKVARDIAMDEQRRAADAAARNQRLQAGIDRLNQLQGQVNAPQQGVMSGVANLLGFGGQQNMLNTDLAQGGVTPQNMTPNTSVMGYSGPVGQIQTGAANQSIYQTADPSQAGLAGTANVSTQRQGSGFSMPSLPSFSEVIDRVIGPTDTYDMSRMTSR